MQLIEKQLEMSESSSAIMEKSVAVESVRSP